MNKNKYKNIIVIVAIVLLFIGAIVLGIILSYDDSEKDKPKEYYSDSLYDFSDKIQEPTGTEVTKNDALSKEQCLNDICVSNVVFYQNETMGRAECTISNHTRKTASGYLKLNFNGQSLIVTYQKLKPGKSVNTMAEFFDMKFDNVENYVLEELTEEEKSNIVVE